MRRFKPGDKVVINKDNWTPSYLDLWGRGVGVGVIYKSKQPIKKNVHEVRWPNCKSFEDSSKIVHHKSKLSIFWRKARLLFWNCTK